MDQDSAVDEAIPIDNISSTVFAKVAEYCKKGGGKKELDDWDAAFLQDLDGCELYLLVLATNYLEVDCFRDRIVDKVAEMIKGKMREEIRASLGIVNDLTLEEEKGINDKYPWALAKKEHYIFDPCEFASVFLFSLISL